VSHTRCSRAVVRGSAWERGQEVSGALPNRMDSVLAGRASRKSFGDGPARRSGRSDGTSPGLFSGELGARAHGPVPTRALDERPGYTGRAGRSRYPRPRTSSARRPIWTGLATGDGQQAAGSGVRDADDGYGDGMAEPEVATRHGLQGTRPTSHAGRRESNCRER
jgi:hypothetical protein